MLIKLKLVSYALTMGVAALGVLPSGSSGPDASSAQLGDEQASAAADHAEAMRAHHRPHCEHGCSVDRMLSQMPR